MAFNDEDGADMLAQIAQLRKQHDALVKAVKKHAAESAAAQFLGDAAYGPLIEQSLDARVDADGNVAVKVVDRAGRARAQIDGRTLRFIPVGLGDLASEIRARWPQLAKADDKPAPEKLTNTNLTENMKAQHEREQAQAAAPMTAAERQAARKANPFVKGSTWNLTDQMRIEKRAPEFARELRKVA